MDQPVIGKCAVCQASLCVQFRGADQFTGLYRPDQHGSLVVTNSGDYTPDGSFTTTVGDGDDATGVQLGPIAKEGRRNGAPVIFFHTACWKILHIASYRQPLDLERLYSVCSSIPPRFREHGQGVGQSQYYKVAQMQYGIALNNDPYNVDIIAEILAEPSLSLEEAIASWQDAKLSAQRAGPQDPVGPIVLEPWSVELGIPTWALESGAVTRSRDPETGAQIYILHPPSADNSNVQPTTSAHTTSFQPTGAQPADNHPTSFQSTVAPSPDDYPTRFQSPSTEAKLRNVFDSSHLNGASQDSLPTAKDAMSKLTPELCSAIASHLPTSDFLNVRLACKTFAPLFYSQQFWASRFGPSSEFGAIFEAWDFSKDHDFRWMYYNLRKNKGKPRLRERFRVWKYSQFLLRIMAYPFIEPSGDKFTAEQTARMRAVTPTQPSPAGTPSFTNERIGFRRYDVILPRDLSQLTVYSVSINYGIHICGITLTPAKGDPIKMGYTSPRHESIDITQPIVGFVMGPGPYGMHSLQCIFEGGQRSSWFGHPKGAPHTQRLSFATPVANITGFFDGCKLVAFCAGPDASAPPEPEVAGFDIKNTALWFPSIPGPTTNLNEAAFARAKSVSTGFHIVNQYLFGGPGGKRLKHLVKISTIFARGIHKICWQYDSPNIVPPMEPRELGWHMESREGRADFEIDGPGGERLIGVDVYLYDEPANGVNIRTPRTPQAPVLGIQLHTNRGRSGILGGAEEVLNHPAVTVRSVKPEGEYITGFYFTEGSNPIFDGLGVISEPVGDMESSV